MILDIFLDQLNSLFEGLVRLSGTYVCFLYESKNKCPFQAIPVAAMFI